MAHLGSVTWDYFDSQNEAISWSSKLRRMGENAKYIGEKSGRFVVQRVVKSPFDMMNELK